MPVSLDDVMKELPPDRRLEVERNASALIEDYRLRSNRSGSEPGERSQSERITVGTKVRTGERCPESGVWQVESKPDATMPITIHNLMPPYRDQAVIWKLIRQTTA